MFAKRKHRMRNHNSKLTANNQLGQVRKMRFVGVDDENDSSLGEADNIIKPRSRSKQIQRSWLHHCKAAKSKATWFSFSIVAAVWVIQLAQSAHQVR